MPLRLRRGLPVHRGGVISAQGHGTGVVQRHARQGFDALQAAGQANVVGQAPEPAQTDRRFAIAPIDAVAHAVFVEYLGGVRQLGVDAGYRGVLRQRRIQGVRAIEAVDKIVPQIELGGGVDGVITAHTNRFAAAAVNGVFRQAKNLSLRNVGHRHGELDAR